MMMMFIARGGEGLGHKNEDRNIGKLPEPRTRALRRVLIARSCARLGGKAEMGELEGVDLMGVRVACRGTRNTGEGREEIKVNPKC